jgi:hypothetical protein
MRCRRLAATLAAVTGIVLATQAASAVSDTLPPPTLSGESFVDNTPSVTGNCNPDGTSTISFSAAGAAAGPYTGTFTEIGTATVGPQTVVSGSPQGTLLTFDAVFTILSSVGNVTGTKTIAFPVTDFATQVAVGDCITLNGAEFREAIDRYTIRYEAEISAPGGEFADRGLVPLMTLHRNRFVDTNTVFFQEFTESFQSDLVATEPLTSPGQATGGGQIPGDVTFGFTAKSDKNGVKGNCTVIDRATNTTLKCLDATTYFQSGTSATFSGNATVNGTPTTYRIKVSDNGEPGTGLDTFTITTLSGYSATGVLTQGNIQIHP